MTPVRRRRGVSPRWVAVLTALLWMLPSLTVSARAAAGGGAPTIEQLQATLLITVARYVEWPSAAFASASAPIVVGIVSDEAVAEELATTSAGRKVNGRAMVAKRLQWDSDMAGVHVLLVGQVERRRVVALLEQVRGKPILTMSLLPQFASTGGMITVTSTVGRLSFSVNARATEATALRLSSLLLSHATSVTHDAGPRVP
jgi:hypothetical protein